ncbi:MAG: hypothetical protein RLZZ28_595, partial [Bacteroidota bacterium]
KKKAYSDAYGALFNVENCHSKRSVPFGRHYAEEKSL